MDMIDQDIQDNRIKNPQNSFAPIFLFKYNLRNGQAGSGYTEL